MEGSTGLTLKLSLDDQSLGVLEDLAANQRCSIDELIMGLVRRAIRNEQKNRKIKTPGYDDAPMDAFLPEGTDPFSPANSSGSGLASSFAEVQTRMRFAGTPSLLREAD
ncbi:MAG: hypothetical protein H7249_20060 [Chitinophagaceae bacterium]|nr:hypothetical protein [Oligoflexus sp.]